MNIAIDFDGTITNNDSKFPEVGSLKKGARKYIKRLMEDGHQIIVNTCRSGKAEGLAEDFLKANKIPYTYINSNLPELIVFFKQDCRKISADLYIDDKCLMGLPSWKQIYKKIQKKVYNEV